MPLIGAGGLGAYWSDSGGGSAQTPWTNLYNQSLQNNTNLYNQMMSSYDQTMSKAAQGAAGVESGYGSLNQQVQGTIQGITASQQQAIKDSYAQQSGTASQGMINAGLGNTTVQQSVQSGLGLQENKAQVALANQQAQLEAGYQSQIGLAGLNYAGQAVAQQASLGSAQANEIAQYKQQMPPLYGMSGGGGMSNSGVIGGSFGLQKSNQVYVPQPYNPMLDSGSLQYQMAQGALNGMNSGPYQQPSGSGGNTNPPETDEEEDE